MRSLVVASALLACTPVAARAEWLSLRSAHHHVVGNVSERELREVALRLEQFYEVIATLNQAQARANDRHAVVVLVFRDDKSYRPYTPIVNGQRLPVGGMFLGGGPEGTYITLNLDAGPDAYPAIYHEYSHFLLRGVFGDAPLWFNEGLAEYYSTLDVTSDGRRAVIGKPVEHHVRLLRERRLPLAKVLSVTRASPEYTRDTPERAMLYAHSWAVVHHAMHGDPQRRNALVTLALALARNTTADQAVRDTYGMALADLEREVTGYTRRELFQATSFEFKEAIVTRLTELVTSADEAHVEAWTGAVQANIGRVDEGEAKLEKALRLNPDLGTAHAALWTVRARQGRPEEARKHLEAARKLDALGPPTMTIQLSDRDARVLAARTFWNKRAFAEVAAVLSPVVDANPDDQEAALMVGEALVELGAVDRARALVGPVLAAPQTDERKAQARALLSRLAARAAELESAAPRSSVPPAPTTGSVSSPPVDMAALRGRLALRAVREGERRAFGTLQAVECRSGGIVIVVRTTGGELRASAKSFDAVDFVTFRASNSSSVSCGAQPPAPALLTWREDGARSVAVALELVPDDFVPPAAN